MSRDMEKKYAYGRVYMQRMRARVKAQGGEICVQCYRRPREVGAVCRRCRQLRPRWSRKQYLKLRPDAGRQKCGTCKEYGHNARSCMARGPRCRCGLMLPCNNCLPTIYDLAASRRGSSTEG